MSQIVSRLKEYLDTKGIAVSKAESMIGVSNGTLSKPFNSGTNVKTDTLEKFLSVFSDIDLKWLMDYQIDAESDKQPLMLGEDPDVYRLRTDREYTDQMIPLYNVEASAGLVDLFNNSQETTPIDTIKIPNLPKCDGAVFVTGDSMYPLLKSGDIVAYKRIDDFKNEIFWGEMYLISVDMSGEEYVSVKYIQKSDKGDAYIKLVSQNQHHQPKDIPLKKVKAVALVKASIRMNSMS